MRITFKNTLEPSNYQYLKPPLQKLFDLIPKKEVLHSINLCVARELKVFSTTTWVRFFFRQYFSVKLNDLRI